MKKLIKGTGNTAILVVILISIGYLILSFFDEEASGGEAFIRAFIGIIAVFVILVLTSAINNKSSK